MLSYFHRRGGLALAAVLAFALAPTLSTPVSAQEKDLYQQVNLISDIPGLAIHQDSNVVNAWGISFSATSPFWISDNGTGVSSVYRVTYSGNIPKVQNTGLVVHIPGDGSVTGQVFNGGPSFHGDRFLFVSEDGTISGWRGALGTNAETLFTGSPDNVYKGVALSGDSLLAANFRSGALDVFHSNGTLTQIGSFTDPTAPAGYAPFNVENVGGKLYVTFAMQDPAKKDDVAGPGFGFVDIFDPTTNTFTRLATGSGAGGTLSELNSPWGLALAPASFGKFAGDLLVGNFGSGNITALDPVTGGLRGQLEDAPGHTLTIDGLWGLAFGNGVAAGKTDFLYFSAGPNGEGNGLFGSLQPVPEPGALALLGAALLPGLAFLRRRRA